MTLEELKEQNEEVVMDIECYPNYFLAKFFFPVSDVFLQVSNHEPNRKLVAWIIENFTLITFNGNGYDIPVLSEFMYGDRVTTRGLYDLGGDLIYGDLRPYQVMNRYREHSIFARRLDHIDLIEVAFGKSSLKTYAGRIHAPYMQDLPYEPYTELTDDQKVNVANYCENDCRNTWLLRMALKGELKLRKDMTKMYGVDLRSLSDAQVAEAVISAEFEKNTGSKPGKKKYSDDYTFKYIPPDYLSFDMPVLQNAFDVVTSATFTLRDGELVMPKEISVLRITIGETEYTMGIGGLHSNEKGQTLFAGEDMILRDSDVTGFYPNIILCNEYTPPHLGKGFLDTYKYIVDTRAKAKREGNKVVADSLKITCNGSFGKFGSKYSFLYSPNLVIQTTITGQLSLLMLVEWLEADGFSVRSGNTDGIVTMIPRERENEYLEIIRNWEETTGYQMEFTDYKALYSRDVNSYIAVKTDGTAKRKGFFAPSVLGENKFSLQKNPAGQIISDAVEQYLLDGTPVEDTVRGCDDIRKFVFVRKVEGGCVTSEGEPVGKVVRWYQGKNEFGHLKYANRNSKVPKSDGAVPLMYMDGTMPDDVDYGWYIMEAKKILNNQFDKPVQLNFIESLFS